MTNQPTDRLTDMRSQGSYTSIDENGHENDFCCTFDNSQLSRNMNFPFNSIIFPRSVSSVRRRTGPTASTCPRPSSSSSSRTRCSQGSQTLSLTQLLRSIRRKFQIPFLFICESSLKPTAYLLSSLGNVKNVTVTPATCSCIVLSSDCKILFM